MEYQQPLLTIAKATAARLVIGIGKMSLPLRLPWGPPIHPYLVTGLRILRNSQIPEHACVENDQSEWMGLLDSGICAKFAA